MARPIMELLELLGRRWVLRILWELRGERLGFRELQARCELSSPSTLSQRLRELADAQLVEASEAGWTLTIAGRRLGELLLPLNEWSNQWARRRRLSSAPRSPI
jgi:DNA-binding HxlR family transcriptional regulator